MPPFSYQAVLRAEAVDRAPVQEFLNSARKGFAGRNCSIHGPYPALMERKGGRVRWYLLVQANSRADLQNMLDGWLPVVRALPQSRQVRWAVDVDPQEF